MWRPVARFVLALAAAAAVSRLLWGRVPVPLSVRTDIVGYQIFAAFNSFRYTYGYYVFALVFPALSVAFYLLIAWRGPLRRRPSPDSRMFPVVDIDSTDDGAQPSSEASQGAVFGDAAWGVARITLPALAVALEVSASSPDNLRLGSTGAYVGAAVYAGGVVLIAGLLGGVAPRGEHSPHRLGGGRWWDSVARVNSLAALSVIPLLYFVSEATSVAVDPGHRIARYPWLPVWLAIAVTAIAIAAWRRGSVRARSGEETRELEAKVLTWVVGPVLLFLVLASLPGALGSFQGFDDAQFLAAPQLIFHQGLFPWRDIYVLHGLLSDVFDGTVGMAVFGNTRWGANAGLGVFVIPLNWVVLYCFAAYFCRKNRLILVGLSIALATGLLQGNVSRFLLFPLFLVLLDQVLRRPGWGRCWLFMFVMFAGVILTPEEGLFVPCLLAVVFLFELTGYQRGEGLRSGFRRTWRCVVAGAALVGAWAAFLAATGALRSFVEFFSVFAQGHGLEGGVPTQWSLTHDLMVTFEWALPTVLWLATIWRVVAKLRTRRPWVTREWVIVAAALCTAIYFPKALDRADPPHVLEAFSITVPLLVLWVVDLLDRGDRSVERQALRLPGGARLVRLRRALTGLAVVGVTAGTVVAPTTVFATMRGVPSDLHRSVTRAQVPAEPMLGYTLQGSVDTGQIQALRAVLDRYAGPDAPVFDYSNELGVLYYLLDRVPGSRYYYSAVAQTSLAQRQEIADLRASRPPVVVFSNTTFGLVSYDGIPQTLRSFRVSQYLFDHYRPLLDVQGQLVLLRNDLLATAPPIPAGFATADLYFDTPTCNFGDIPNFFDVPPAVLGQAGIPLAAEEIAHFNRTFSGWAVDRASGGAATEVLAAVDGVVVAMAPTGSPRLDVAAALHARAAINSGFSLSIPASTAGAVVLYALNGDGTVSPLVRGRAVPAPMVGPTPARAVTTPDGHRHQLRQGPAAGTVDGVSRQPIVVRRLHVPDGVSASGDPWLRVVSPSTLRDSTVTLTDDAAAPPGHQIVFHLLARSGTRVTVRVGNCLQWHGYSSARELYVVQSGADQPLSFSLVAAR